METVPVPVSQAQMAVAEKISNCNSCFRRELTHLVLWRDWRKTLLVFGILQALIFDLAYKSAISVVSVSALVGLFITIGYRVYVRCLQWMNKTPITGNPFQDYLDMDIFISEEMAQQVSLLVSIKIVGFVDKLRSVVLAEKPLETAKWIGILAMVTLVGEIFYVTTLMQLGVMLTFSIPKIYEWKQPIFDFQVEAFQKFLKWGYPEKSPQLQIESEPNGDSVENSKWAERNPTDKEFQNVIQKHIKPKDNSVDTKESSAKGDDQEQIDEISSEDFERFADSWNPEGNDLVVANEE